MYLSVKNSFAFDVPYFLRCVLLRSTRVYLLQLCGKSDMVDAEERCGEAVEVFVVRATDVAMKLKNKVAYGEILTT